MKVGDYYEIAKENTSQEILGAVQDTKETVQNFHAGGVPPANMKAINVAVGAGKLKLIYRAGRHGNRKPVNLYCKGLRSTNEGRKLPSRRKRRRISGK